MFFTSWVEHQLLKTVGKIVAFPVTGPVNAGKWMLETIHEEVMAEQTDEDRVMSKLTELQLRYELGEVEQEEYLREETEIMEDLNSIREAKKDEQFEPSEFWWSRAFGGD